MEARELRIGDIVGFKNRTDLYCVVKSIYSPGIHVVRYFNSGEEDDQPEAIEDITPIPLTEDWLVKFGFENVGMNFQKDWLLLHKHLKQNSFDFLVHLPGMSSYHATQLFYVHQLQNLYFALTGEELTMKENEALPE